MTSSELILALIKSVITDTPCAVLQNIETPNYEEIFAISTTHDLTALVSQGLYQTGLFPQGEWGSRFKMAQIEALGRCTRMDYERNLVCRALSEESIQYILLKGSVLKDYYPESYMRAQCDIDILVKKETLSRVEDLFVQRMGFIKIETSNHDVAYRTPRGVRIELHFALLEEHNQHVDEILSTAWERVNFQPENCCHGAFTFDFFVFYHIAHMEKHFLYGGCGIKPLIDLWLLRHKIGFDIEKATAMFARCGLTTFFQESMHLCEVWFGSASHTELTKKMEDYILGAGVYGALENEVAISQIKKGGRWGHLLSKLFLNYRTMKIYYPSLARAPFLFPFYQVVRWVRLLLTDERSRVFHEINTNHTITKEKRREVAALCKQLNII